MERLFNDKIIAIYQRDENSFSFSLRKGNSVKIDLDRLAKEAIGGIENADGGGHPDAAGIRVPIRNLKALIENMRLRTEKRAPKR